MMNILKFVSTSLLLFVALTGVAQAKEGAVAAKEVAAQEKQFSSEIQKKLQTKME
jgi:hypothetical protein